MVTHYARIHLSLKGHREWLLCYVTKLGQYNLVLGQSWVDAHRAALIDRTVTFGPSCYGRCIKSKFIAVESVDAHSQTVRATADSIDVGVVERAEFDHLSQQPGAQCFLFRLSDLQETPLSAAGLSAARDVAVSSVGEEGPIMPEPFEGAFDPQTPLSLRKVQLEDVDKFLNKATPTAAATKLKVPDRFHEFLDVFSHSEANKLPPHRPGVDHEINLKEGTEAPFQRMRPMAPAELEATKKYLNDMLQKGFIRPSSSPAAAPVLIVKKPGGGLRFCVDYRGINEITIKNRYPIPSIGETLNRLGRSKRFTKIDIIAAFNEIRMADGHEWKTAFNTRFGQYEYLVMPFGLCNALSTF